MRPRSGPGPRRCSSAATRARRGVELEEAFARGVISAGGDCILGGVLPTPAVALLALDLGVVISASHNPPEYNGVKFFDSQGHKLSDAAEEQIEELLAAAPGIDQGSDRARRGRDRLVPAAHPRSLRLRSDRPAHRRRLRERRVLGARAARIRAVRRRGARDRRRARTASNINVGCGATDLAAAAADGARRRLRPRHRLRRRRRPDARGRRERRGDRRRPDHRDARARPRGRRRRCDGDDESRLPRADAASAGSAC